jgi:hypothetical protein
MMKIRWIVSSFLLVVLTQACSQGITFGRPETCGNGILDQGEVCDPGKSGKSIDDDLFSVSASCGLDQGFFGGMQCNPGCTDALCVTRFCFDDQANSPQMIYTDPSSETIYIDIAFGGSYACKCNNNIVRQYGICCKQGEKVFWTPFVGECIDMDD